MNPLLLLIGILGAGAAGKSLRGKSDDHSKGIGRDDGTDIAPTDGDDTPGDFGTDTTDTGSGDDAPTGINTGGTGSTGDTDTGGTTATPTGKDSTDTGDTGGSTGGTGTTTGSTGGTNTGTTGSTGSDTTGGTGGTGDTGTGTTGGTTTGTTGGTTGSTGGTTGSTGGSTGSTGGTDTSGSGHTMGTGTPSIQPPGVGASQAQIDAYVAQLAAQPEMHVHNMGTSKAPEHDAAMNLVPRGAATHVAIGDGDWFDPAIWSNGQVPDDNAKVLIPEGVTVNYGGVSGARLFTVRVDGVLDFETDVDSQMIFDTVVVSPSGHLVIGTTTDPVDPGVDIDLIVANNGPIDTNWDPMLLSRGIISHGGTSIHGAVKDSHEKVVTDPMSGDTSLKFAATPQGWEVGDTIVVAGTHYDGYTWDNTVRDVIYHPSEDETRVITGIDADGTVHLDKPLAFDHDAPRADLKTSVANYTRNVSVETENADSAAIYERGHVMFMHSDNVDVRYAEFLELGRTDKSIDSQSAESFGQTSFDSNVQGRYALHLHRTGTSDPNDPAIVMGNAVYGSPGWGYVHHDSNAILENNASFDTFGAGFVAETGNEIGAWNDNIAILAQGNSWAIPKDGQNLADFDIARTGDGFWFQGRMVTSTNNVAASVNTGFVYFHRDGPNGMIDFDADAFAFPEALLYNSNTQADLTPILTFSGNETFAAKEGLHVVKAGPNQGHDVWSHLKDFTAWSVISGAHLEYTSHYVLENFDLVSRVHDPFIAYSSGISFGNNASDITVVGGSVEGFREGINLHKLFTPNTPGSPSDHNFVVIDTSVTGANTPYVNYDPALDQILSSGQLPFSAPDLQLDNQLVLNAAPTNTTIVFSITGTKTDSLGQTTFPGGTENFNIEYSVARNLLAHKGYWTTSSGQNYTLLDIYFTDRLTGEVYVETHPVYVNDSVAGITHHGTQDIANVGGTLHAGSTPLDVATLAVPVQAAATTTMTHTQGAMVPDATMASPDMGGMQTASFTSSVPQATLAADSAPAPADSGSGTEANAGTDTGADSGSEAGADTGAETGSGDTQPLAIEDDAVFALMDTPEDTGEIFTDPVTVLLGKDDQPVTIGGAATEETAETQDTGTEETGESGTGETEGSEETPETSTDDGEDTGQDTAPDDVWCLLTEDQGVVCDGDGPASAMEDGEDEDETLLFAA